jgi:ubiquinone/menaquinone biosynthesis C-methylase UbiE
MDANQNNILAHKTDYDPSAFIIESVKDIEKEKRDAAIWWAEYQSTYFLDLQLQTKIIISTLKKYPDIKSVFEFGCHAGRNLYYIKQEFPDVEVHGVDLNQEAVKIGKKKFALPIEVGDELSLLLIPDNSYDVVFTVSVIDHLLEPEKICKDLTRISKRHIVLLEPFFEREGKIVKMIVHDLTEDFFPFSYSWDYEKIFSNLHVKPISNIPTPLEGGFAGPYYRLYTFEKIC